MTNLEFVEKLKDVVNNHKTLYVMGCFGAPMTAANKKRYTNNHEYNRKAKRVKMIEAASSDTFGFDCVCLIKGILWGWNGDKTKTYGGAYYCANGVPDIGTESMIEVCSDLSSDFNNVTVGELLWMSGHTGIYIGNGLAVECTPSWENKVQITACNRDVKGYKRRNWKKHGRLPYIDYEIEQEEKPRFSVLEWQNAAVKDGFAFPKYGCDGKWGAECESVAKKAICKKRTLSYKYPNLTKLVQKIIGFKGDDVDGKFGKDTKEAVKRYQKAHNLAADGEVGINTWKVMMEV